MHPATQYIIHVFTGDLWIEFVEERDEDGYRENREKGVWEREKEFENDNFILVAI